jgi:hypothetical protein
MTKRKIYTDADLDKDWFVRVRVAKGRDAMATQDQINRILDDLYRRGYYVSPPITGDIENGAIITYFRKKPNWKRY